MGVKFKPRKNRNSYRFGEDLQRSLGYIEIRIPSPRDRFVFLNVDVVNVDVPFLIGLDVLDQLEMTVDTVENALKCPSLKWKIPFVVYVAIPKLQIFTFSAEFEFPRTRAMTAMHEHCWRMRARSRHTCATNVLATANGPTGPYV